MSEHAPTTQDRPSLEWLVENFDTVMADADRLTEEHVEPGHEDATIAKLDHMKIYYLEPLLGKMHYESGSQSLEDQGTTENPMDYQANDLIQARINRNMHRRDELQKQKESRT